MNSSSGQTDAARAYFELGGRTLLTEACTQIEQDGCTSTPPPGLSHRSLLYPDWTSVTPERTYHIVTQQPSPTQLAEKCSPTIPTSLISQESSPSSPHSTGLNPKPHPPQLPSPQPEPDMAGKNPKDSPPGATHRPEVGSPSNPINIDDADMINQLYAGTYDLGDDDPPTPQSNTSSNTRQK
ncbi:hypothetical protein SERLA73DRAFT_74992 [Serpula lacrymans var. lacrymans S7.3]|uniref:Uncharacterized protein n=2 Tax=Serpula lacrymans var. lacrymans TaxID=341189 RepID=F8Q274_SERL3|nr:uncharacterized protein SERLADRAFT_439651 [Serpula lacrymans var. lacrymans S7.9]EGN97285.1 hypothetical protein SERLA73DRAFT_74992 [Serpula lacrymans var. lacrymans S7.3]EGO22876.1 hypothetical protein SERLADRAFT_439651 [Serpula lacrymans var. lacrymans S7.9]